MPDTIESDQTFKRICYRVGIRKEREGNIFERIKNFYYCATVILWYNLKINFARAINNNTNKKYNSKKFF